MKKKTRTILLIALSLILLVSLCALGYELIQYRKGDEAYQQAEKLAGLPDLTGLANTAAPSPAASDSPADPETDAGGADAGGAVWTDPYADALRNMDLSSLKEVNGDVTGWICVPNTAVSYPMVYGAARDSTFYLNHNWAGNNSIVGAIFIDPANSPSMKNFNTVIYGHNMNNGSMFGTLKNFRSQSYYAAHPNIYITTESGAACYQIFSAYEVSTEGTSYQLRFGSQQERQDFIDFCLAQSVISTGVTPTANDHIVTLSTCTGYGHSTRWVVQAVLVNTAPAAETPAEASAAPAQASSPEVSASPAPETSAVPQN